MKLGVCVPYRNREEHMNQFVPHVTKFLEERGHSLKYDDFRKVFEEKIDMESYLTVLHDNITF